MLMLGLLGDQTYTVRGVQSLFGLWTYTSAPDLILTYIIVACQQKKKVQNHDQGNKKIKELTVWIQESYREDSTTCFWISCCSLQELA